MHNKILFLDFDGVLNSLRTWATAGLTPAEYGVANPHLLTRFDPIAVSLIRRLVNVTECKIVISSAWQESHTLDAIRKMFKDEFHWKDADEVFIGVTGPEIDSRGAIIKQWIDNHAYRIEDFKYAIVDDNDTMLPEQKPVFVHTDPENGLMYRDFISLRTLLT